MDSVRLIVTVALLCLAGCASPAAEPAEPAPQELAAEPKELAPDADAAPAPERFIAADRRAQSMRINIDVKDVDLSEVMEQIGRQVGRSILVDPKVKETVTVSLRDIGWREAVEVIAKMTRTEVEDRPGEIVLLTQP